MKSLVALILTISLVLVPCFAYADTASGSALTIDEQLWIMNEGGIKPVQVAAVEAGAVKATPTPDGSQARPFYSIANTEGLWSGWYLDDNNEESDTTQVSILSFVQLFQEMYDGIVVSLQNQMKYLFYHQVPLEGGGYSESGLIMMERNLLGSYVALLEMQPVLNTVSSRINTTNSRLNTANNHLSTIITDIVAGNTAFTNEFAWDFSGTYGLPRYRQQSNGGSSQDLTPQISAHNLLNTIFYSLNNINASMVYAARDLLSGVASSVNGTYLDKDLVSHSLGRQSFWYDVRALGTNINDIVARLGYVLASDDEIAAHQSATANTQAAITDFVSSSGNASVSASNLGDLAGFTSSITDNIVPGTASPTLLVNTLNDDDVWSWFTQSTADALEPSSRLRNESKSSDPSVSSTPLLDSYYHDLEQALGVSYDR